MNFVADLHTHTIASGHAYSTVLEIARAAQERNLHMVAITDHGPKMPGGPHPYHFGNLSAIPRTLFGVEILGGAEVNVLDREGLVDLPNSRLQALDIVLAGLHTNCFPEGSVEDNTQGMIAAMRNPYIDIIVHPGNPEFAIDPEKIAKAAADHEIAIEVNNSSLTTCRFGSERYCKDILRYAKQYKTMLAANSDSHIALTVGETAAAKALISAAGIPETQVLNTSVEKIRNYLALRHANRPK